MAILRRLRHIAGNEKNGIIKFLSMFEGNQTYPEHLRNMILECETERDNL